MTEVISYEDLYDLLRIEKASADLEKLTLKDLYKIASYFKAKDELMKQQEVSTAFSSTRGRAKIQLEIDNAMQMVKDLFERREAKVINRAVFSIRSDSKLKDTTNMLEHEEAFYNVLLDLLAKNKKEFFELLEAQKEQIIIAEPKEEEELKEEAEETKEEPSVEESKVEEEKEEEAEPIQEEKREEEPAEETSIEEEPQEEEKVADSVRDSTQEELEVEEEKV